MPKYHAIDTPLGMTDFEELLDVAIEITEEAAAIAYSYFRQAVLIEMKPDHTPVTIADKKTEEMIRTELSKTFPGFGIWGEEFGEEGTDQECVWTVDPIDGTRSFIRGIPLFGTLLGLLVRGEPVLGVMVLPALEETYSAAKGQGTFCNGRELHVSPTAQMESALISCGDLSCFRAAGKEAVFQSLSQRSELLRTYSDGFGHSLVFRGSMDAMIDPVVSIWDVAPLACLVREAGGDYFDLTGERTIRGKGFVSCNSKLRDELLPLLR